MPADVRLYPARYTRSLRYADERPNGTWASCFQSAVAGLASAPAQSENRFTKEPPIRHLPRFHPDRAGMSPISRRNRDGCLG